MNHIQPIKTAICSFGMSGRLFHAPFIALNPKFELNAVWERTKNEARKIYPDIQVYRTLEDLLGDSSIELVIVNTPNATHYDYVKKALEAGKHVVVEKPFVLTTAEGLELNRLAQSKGKILSVYQNRRYDSDYRTIKKVLDSGVLGKVVEMDMRFDRYRLGKGAKVHKEIPGPGTGNLYDLGSHLLDQAIQLFGLPERVFADIFIITEESEVDNYFELILHYDGLRVRVHSSYVTLKQQPGYVIQGTRGSFFKAKTNQQEEQLSLGKSPEGEDWGKEPENEYGQLTTIEDGNIKEKTIISEQGNYMDYYDGIYRAIRDGGKNPVTAIEATKVIYLIEKAYESNETKQVVRLDWKE